MFLENDLPHHILENSLSPVLENVMSNYCCENAMSQLQRNSQKSDRSEAPDSSVGKMHVWPVFSAEGQEWAGGSDFEQTR